MPKTRTPAMPARLHMRAGRYYWKPEARLRPAWRAASLGTNQALAVAEARRLNKKVDEWLATERPASAPRRAQPRTVSELIELWRAGPMQEKKVRTRRQYDYELDRLAREFGHEPAATLSAERVDEWADPLRKSAPSTLRLVASRGRAVFHWAGRKGFIPAEVNPFRQMRLPGGGKRRFRFAWADVKHLVAVAEQMNAGSLGYALACGFLTVQRITDVLELTGAAIVVEGTGENTLRSLRFRQSKTRFEVDQEWPSEIDALMGRAPDEPRPAADPLFPSERSGTFWNEKYASRVFAKILAKAIDADPRAWKHLKGGQLRDCRRSGFVHGVLNGASVEVMCSLSGHTIQEGLEIIEHYLPKTRAAADQARVFMRVG